MVPAPHLAAQQRTPHSARGLGGHSCLIFSWWLFDLFWHLSIQTGRVEGEARGWVTTGGSVAACPLRWDRVCSSSSRDRQRSLSSAGTLPLPPLLQTLLWLVKRERWRVSEQQQSLLGRGKRNLPGLETSGWDMQHTPVTASPGQSQGGHGMVVTSKPARADFPWVLPALLPSAQDLPWNRRPRCRSRQAHRKGRPMSGSTLPPLPPLPSMASGTSLCLRCCHTRGCPRRALLLRTCLKAAAAGTARLPRVSQASRD